MDAVSARAMSKNVNDLQALDGVTAVPDTTSEIEGHPSFDVAKGAAQVDNTFAAIEDGTYLGLTQASYETKVVQFNPALGDIATAAGEAAGLREGLEALGFVAVAGTPYTTQDLQGRTAVAVTLAIDWT